MKELAVIKAVLEVVVLLAFVFLLIHVAKKDGRQGALSLLTNLP